MATATEERRTHSRERSLWRTAPQPGMTADHPERFRQHDTIDAPRRPPEGDGIVTRLKNKLFSRR